MNQRPVPAGLTALADFQPSAASAAPTPSIKEAAAAHGFVDRHPVSPRRRQRGTDEPMCSFTARVSVSAHDRFVTWCERERISYREGFDRLMTLLDQA